MQYEVDGIQATYHPVDLSVVRIFAVIIRYLLTKTNVMLNTFKF
jgi:hypothetical protein